MKSSLFLIVCGVLVVTTQGSISVASAGVNCEQVKKYKATGRTEQDIAETMIIDVETVKKCLSGDSSAPSGTPPAAAK